MTVTRYSRRTFLQGASTAAALGCLGTLPARRLWAAPVAEFIPEPDDELLRELALRAIDAARAAGASFADVRMTGGRQLRFAAGFDQLRGEHPAVRWPRLILETEYGVRAVVDGVWGFAGGYDLTPDAVAAAARTAVARARANRPHQPRTLELAPIPRTDNGTWATPIARDPFTVPIGEQSELALDALHTAAGVPGVRWGAAQFMWTQNVRVFASSEGALTVQRVAFAWPGVEVVARAGDGFPYARRNVEELLEGGYGYEAVTGVDLAAALRHAAEHAIAESRAYTPPIPAEVGRYDLVFGGEAVAGLLTATLAQAVNLERALGYRANHEGTSFAAPPEAILGQYQVGASSLTVRADRTRPHAPATVGWDDEGVPAGEHTLVQDGVIVDYLSSRETAPALADWYAAHGAELHSRGCASGGGQALPEVRLPNLTLQPGQDDVPVDDLIADTKRGFYIERCGGSSDQQVLNSQFSTATRGVREIRNGKLGDWVEHLAFQFVTPEFWKSVDALGGARSIVETQVGTGHSRYDPLQLPSASVRTVPLRVRDVNVLNTGRMA